MKATILKSVMCVVLAVAGVFNANLSAQGFITNDVLTDGVVTSKIIYRHDGALYQHIKYDFTYNETGQVITKEVFKWDGKREAWVPYYQMTFSYSETEVTVDYGKWNAKQKAYNRSQERNVYALDAFRNPLTLQSYKWNENTDNWVMASQVAFNNNGVLYVSGI